ncbi:MAG: CcmD family protein [Candidatus Halalkalibacterium sp. M3_1C_030]
MKINLFNIQEDSVAAVDTLTETYSQKWNAANEFGESSGIIQAAASYDLIFIVLAVSLIIWLVLLFFIVRVDKKVSKLEEQVEQTKTS